MMENTAVKANIVNLTPHDVNIMTESGEIVVSFPSVGVARATQQAEVVGNLNGLDIVSMKFGNTENLPAFEEGTFYIVSIITLNAARAEGRSVADLLMTADPVRNETGQIIGCLRLATQVPEAFA